MTTSSYFAASSSSKRSPRGVLAVLRARKRRRADPAPSAGGASSSSPPVRSSLTEMERQVVDLRARHPDMLLLFECGYLLRAFAEDADIAGKTLGISVAQYKSFQQASVPVHRALHHCRALVEAGHKVGIVRQVDTVAMRNARSSENPRDASGGHQRPVLRREVVEVYTRATIPFADVECSSQAEKGEASSGGTSKAVEERDQLSASRFILCIVEATVHRTTLFAKKLHEIDDDDDSERSGRKQVDDVQIGLFAHDVHTGESLFDEFCDGANRNELRDALTRIEPVEIVLPVGRLSVYTEQLLQSYAHMYSKLGTHRGRIQETQQRIRFERTRNEVFNWDNASVAFAQFFDDAERAYSHYSTRPRLPALCICCFGGMQSYLKQFALEQSLSSVKYSCISKLAASSNQDREFSLSSDCIRDLDIFRNSVDNEVTGSLFSILNHTKTDAGARKLRAWMSSPSVSVSEIEERQTAVLHLSGVGDGAMVSYRIVYEELVETVLPKARPVLRWINQVHTRKVSPVQLVRGLERLLEIESLVEDLADHCSVACLDLIQLDESRKIREPTLLLRQLQGFPRLRLVVTSCLEEINRDAAIANDPENAILPRLRLNADSMKKYQELCEELRVLDAEFEKVLAGCQAALQDSSLQFLSIQYGAGKAVHHLVSVERELLHLVPSDWLVVNSTKKAVRFHPREIHQLHLREDFLLQMKSQLVQRTWSEFVARVDAQVYVMVIVCVEQLASLDAICSLAAVARTQPGYTLPTIVPHNGDDQVLEIVGGRNAILETTLSGSANMSNSVTMASRGDSTDLCCSEESTSAKGSVVVISGPNMGGKSSLLRMCALIVILAQIGSYVPADSVRLSLFDGIYSRMHRSSSLHQFCGGLAVDDATSMRGNEMEALSAISRHASSRSLVLIDEIGFGLTTEQASAVAFGLVVYLVESVGCHVLFATHMAGVAERLKRRLCERCQTKQFGFSVSERGDEFQQQQQMVFHYTIKDGIASDSFAMHAARLAGVPEAVVLRAAAMVSSASRIEGEEKK